jgi:hypothetical protein
MKMDLHTTPGHGIDAFCQNRFTDPTINHCAHFVCHQIGWSDGMTCSALTGRHQPAAGVRVHELFAKCARVGWMSDWDGDGDALVFVTAKGNVALSEKRMANVPKKHVGILRNGQVFHYSNTKDQVVAQSLAKFQQTFDATYGGPQGYYFGLLPGRQPMPAATTVDAQVDYAVRGRDVFAKVEDSSEFRVGRRTRYQGLVGLMQPSDSLSGPIYDPDHYRDHFETWADLVFAIGVSESQNRFNRLNTYDRAAFTFGFFQMAAHTPRDNLVLLLRRAVELPEFNRLFPDLQLREGRLHHVDGGISRDLEAEEFDAVSGENQLRALMRYLNPSSSELDPAEIVAAAKLVHLCEVSPAFCDLQVRTAIQICVTKFRNRYQRWYDLTGAPDTVCVAIADIHHQGRATRTTVRRALDSADPLSALVGIGRARHANRCDTLRNTVAELVDQGRLGTHVFEPAHGLFVRRQA